MAGLNEEIKYNIEKISFDAIHKSIRSFVYSTNRRPNLIVMHPADGEKFMELMHKEFRYCAIQNLMNFQGVKIIRSFDVEEGKWCIY